MGQFISAALCFIVLIQISPKLHQLQTIWIQHLQFVTHIWSYFVTLDILKYWKAVMLQLHLCLVSDTVSLGSWSGRIEAEVISKITAWRNDWHYLIKGKPKRNVPSFTFLPLSLKLHGGQWIENAKVVNQHFLHRWPKYLRAFIVTHLLEPGMSSSCTTCGFKEGGRWPKYQAH